MIKIVLSENSHNELANESEIIRRQFVILLENITDIKREKIENFAFKNGVLVVGTVTYQKIRNFLNSLSLTIEIIV